MGATATGVLRKGGLMAGAGRLRGSRWGFGCREGNEEEDEDKGWEWEGRHEKSIWSSK